MLVACEADCGEKSPSRQLQILPNLDGFGRFGDSQVSQVSHIAPHQTATHGSHQHEGIGVIRRGLVLQAAGPEGDSLTKGPKLEGPKISWWIAEKAKLCAGAPGQSKAFPQATGRLASSSISSSSILPSPCPSVWGNEKTTSPEPQLESSRLNHLNNLHL
jgi:hypothetical protein